MTLLDWLQQTANAHLVGECFEVQSDLIGATEALGTRAHLLPMSDSILLNVGLGIALNGEFVLVEWPSSDLSTIAAWVNTLPESGIGTMVIRIHVGTGAEWSTIQHPAVEVWSVSSDSQRREILQRALSHRRVIILLESSAAMAWDKLEGSTHTGSYTEHGDTPAHCVLVSANLDAPIVQNALDTLTEQGISVLWVEQHNVTGFDTSTLQHIFDTGRVVCVGLPASWMSRLVSKAFWRLENEPLFCEANETSIVESVYATLEP